MLPNTKNVLSYCFGKGAILQLNQFLPKKTNNNEFVTYIIDSYFEGNEIINSLPIKEEDKTIFINSSKEITTDLIDSIVRELREIPKKTIAIVGIGGGSALDSAKAISNLLTNPGLAQDYQGWDLVKKPGVYKIGIPTLSGTGAEASRTCVMMNFEKNLKLGMNSHFTIYDQLILDPELTKTVPKEQYFYTGMDTYIHCIESLSGNYRHFVGDSFSKQALQEVREVFLESQNPMSEENRSKLMVASYLGGAAIANSYVGIVHPFSAGLSVVLGIHHCEANCIVMMQMEEFYPLEVKEFKAMLKKQNIKIKRDLCSRLGEEDLKRLYLSTIVHEKPLINALGDNFKEILTEKKVIEIFKRM